LISNKAILRSYNYFLHFFIYIQVFGKNDSSKYVQNSLVLAKNDKELYG
jgi:hypothetical protein